MNAVLQRVHDAVTRAREVTDHPVLEHLARVGLVAYGVLHVLIGWLAFQVAWSSRPDAVDADQTGALRTLLDAPFGKALLTLVAVGIAAFGVFCFFRARFPERT